MKLLAAIPAAVLAFALFFSVVEHPLLRIAAILLLAVAAIGYATKGRRFFRQLDELTSSRPRRYRVFPFVGLALVAGAGGCRPEPQLRAPEPVAALAEVETLDCGARACAVTEVGGATMITVLE